MAMATMPVEFDLPGSQPDSWEEEIRTNVNLDDALLDQVKNYQGKIKDNREMLKTNARKFQWGAVAGVAAPVVGFAIWAAVSICFSWPSSQSFS